MKITDFGVAIVESDSHLCKWVQEQRTLAVADAFCRLFTPYIPKGGVVMDVGACIGDHTVTYAEMVGPTGKVIAIEPNPVAYRCLVFNVREMLNVHPNNIALGAVFGSVMSRNSPTQPNNLGAARVTFISGSPRGTPLHRLDDAFGLDRLDFIKIDAEGYEPDIIAGGMETLRRLRPVLLIEINRPILAERGKTDADIIEPLRALGYTIQPAEPHLSMDLPMIDVLCLPSK